LPLHADRQGSSDRIPGPPEIDHEVLDLAFEGLIDEALGEGAGIGGLGGGEGQFDSRLTRDWTLDDHGRAGPGVLMHDQYPRQRDDGRDGGAARQPVQRTARRAGARGGERFKRREDVPAHARRQVGVEGLRLFVEFLEEWVVGHRTSLAVRWRVLAAR
jgi:hypothetical protein